MGHRDLGFFLVPLLALMAWFVPATGSSIREPDAPGRGANAADQTLATEPGPRTAGDLLREYSAVPPAPGSGASTDTIKAEKCLIATLPDPIDAANLNYTYDRYLDAIQRALEATDYVLDRFDVPWLDRDAASAAGQPPGAKSEPRFRREPGRLLFRSTSAGEGVVPATAIVFIVGETPTGGIHKVAFAAALNEYSANCEDAGAVPVLGPSFSGSESSLHALLHARRDSKFRVISGSATAIRSAALTRETGATFQATVAQDVDARNRLLANIAAREDARLGRGVRQWLHSLTWLHLAPAEPIRVALLVEANTSFGHAAQAPPRTPKPPSKGPSKGPSKAPASPKAPASQEAPAPPQTPAPPQAPAGHAACSGSPPAGSPLVECIPPGIDLIRLPFPLHISSLRAAARETGAANTTAADPAGNHRSLTSVDLREASPSRTIIPLASRLETSSMEIVLSTLLGTLEEARVRYIGLVATDIEDRIFLSQQIRRHLPNSVLFMFSADLLYMHPDVNVDLRGAEIVTNYPLFSANQEWTPAAEESRERGTAAEPAVGRRTSRLLFPTHTTQGVYNAALALLGAPDRMQEYGYPLDLKKTNALWLSIVGADGVWPVALLGEADGRDMVPPSDKTTTRVPVVSTSNHPWMPIIVLILCVVPALFVRANVSPRTPLPAHSTLSKGPVAKLFTDTIYSGHVLARRLYLFACWAALSSAYLLTVTLFLLPALTYLAARARGAVPSFEWIPSSLTLLFDAVLAAGAVVMLATLVRLAWLVWMEKDPPEAARKAVRRIARIGMSVVAGLLVLLTIWLCWRWMLLAGRAPAEAVFLYMRGSDLGSGVSPLLPLVLICSAAVAWSLSSLRRLQLLEGPDQYEYRSIAQTPGTGVETATVRLKPPFDEAQDGPEFIEGPDTTDVIETATVRRKPDATDGFETATVPGSDFKTATVRLKPDTTDGLETVFGPSAGDATIASAPVQEAKSESAPVDERPNSFLGLDGPSFEGIASLEQGVLDAVGRRTTHPPYAVLAGIVGFLLVGWLRLFWMRSVPTAEGTEFDVLFAVGFLMVYTALAMSFLRFVFIWRKLLRLLQRLAWHPTVKAYERLRKATPGKPKINLTAPSQIFTALEFSVDRGGQLVALARQLMASGTAERGFTAALRGSVDRIEAHVQKAEHSLHAALDAEAHGKWRDEVTHRTEAEQQLALVARIITVLLRPAWRLPATDAPQKGTGEPNEIQWFELGEEFLISRVAAFLSHVVPQLQNLIVFVTSGLLLMLLAVTSYPFQPRQLLLLFNTTVILAVVSATLVVFVQMERETILSVMSDSEPGQISWNRDFVSRVGVYVILPIVSLLGAQFPETAQQIFKWTSSFFNAH